MTDNQPVEKVLRDVNLLLQQRHDITMSIERLERRLFQQQDAESQPPPTEEELVTIPYSILHHIILERNQLLTNLAIHKRAISNQKKMMDDQQQQTETDNRSAASLLNSSAFLRQQGHTSLNEFMTPEEIERAVSKFQAGPRKIVDEAAREMAIAQLKYFHRPDIATDIPSMPVEPLKGGGAVSTLKGPGHSSAPFQSFGNHWCGHSISTYPAEGGFHQRIGDPICDRYFAKLYENRIISAVAEGCGWHEPNRAAAKRACKAFTLFMNDHQKGVKNLVEVAQLMLDGFGEAHRAITESNGTLGIGGAATMNGSILMRASPGNGTNSKWVYMCCNLGGCKTFHWSVDTKRVREITRNPHFVSSDYNDYGGRLGPSLEHGNKPDLRNLSIHYQYCVEGDIIITVTDGVHGNFDLPHQGILPIDKGLSANSWSEVNPKKLSSLNRRHMETQIGELIESLESPVTVEGVCQALTEYCWNSTKRIRKFMAERKGRVPHDYTEYPGKVDHATAVCFRVGDVSLSYDQWMGK